MKNSILNIPVQSHNPLVMLEEQGLLLDILLEKSASRHKKLCPRQILGVRMGLFGLDLMKMDIAKHEKRLCVIIEMDGCFADGVEVATECTIGGRTLKVKDFGKVAATFLDLWLEKAIRLSVREGVRQLALEYADHARNRYEAQLQGYKIMPYEELFFVQDVLLEKPIREVVGEAGKRVKCDRCGEEVMNGREIDVKGMTWCRSCFGDTYYVEVDTNTS